MHDLVRSNKFRSAALVGGFIVLVTFVGAVVGFLVGNAPLFAALALLVGAGFAGYSYWRGDALVLRVSRAQPADPQQYQRLHNLVEGLCIAAGLPKPGVYIVDDPAPNAFVTGRNPGHATIAVTTGLLDTLNRVELEGVVGHELSHIRSYDILLSTLAVTTVGASALVSDLAIRTRWWNGGRVARRGDHPDTRNPIALVGFALLIASPLVAKVMQVTVPRSRVTVADVSACRLTRYPPGLLSALEKLRDEPTATHSASTGTAHLWLVQPMSGVGDDGKLPGVHEMFDTHPPLDERLALLREL